MFAQFCGFMGDSEVYDHDDNGDDDDDEFDNDDDDEFDDDDDDDERLDEENKYSSGPAKPWVEVQLDNYSNQLYETSCTLTKALNISSEATRIIKEESEKQIPDVKMRSNSDCSDYAGEAMMAQQHEEGLANYQQALSLLNSANTLDYNLLPPRVKITLLIER